MSFFALSFEIPCLESLSLWKENFPFFPKKTYEVRLCTRTDLLCKELHSLPTLSVIFFPLYFCARELCFSWRICFTSSFRFGNDFQSGIRAHDYVAIQAAKHPSLAWCKIKISFLMSCYAHWILQIKGLILWSPFLTKTSFTAAYVTKWSCWIN